MSLTKERLLETRQQAVAKRQQLFEMIQQANGAIDMIDHLLQQLDQTELEPQDDAN
jgi:hypothetical protein